MSKKITKSDAEQFSELLHKCERQCQREFRLGRSSSFGRCQEKHLQKSNRGGRLGPAILSIVKINRTKKMFCQWCAKMLMDDLQPMHNVTEAIPYTKPEVVGK